MESLRIIESVLGYSGDFFSALKYFGQPKTQLAQCSIEHEIKIGKTDEICRNLKYGQKLFDIE